MTCQKLGGEILQGFHRWRDFGSCSRDDSNLIKHHKIRPDPEQRANTKAFVYTPRAGRLPSFQTQLILKMLWTARQGSMAT